MEDYHYLFSEQAEDDVKGAADDTAAPFPAPLYPHVCIPLVGEDGNSFAILLRVTRALIAKGVPAAERHAFLTEAMAGDRDHLLRTVMRWVKCD